MRPSLSPLALAAIVLSACAVGPDYHRPTVELPEQFRGTADIGQRTAAPSAPELSSWWQGFNDPVLNRVVTTALAQNLDLAQAVARVSQARAGTESARAALLPSGQLSAQAARAHQSLEDPVVAAEASSIPGFNRNSYYYNVDAGASWEIDLFGGLRRSAEAAQAEYEATQAASAAARLEVIAATADTYVLVRTLQARLQLAREQTATQQDRVRLVRLLASRGLAPDWQLREAQGVLSEVSASVPALETGQVSARNALDVLMGRTPGTSDPDLDAIAPIPSAPAVQTAVGPADLLRRRPDIIVAERRLAASNARIGEALSDYYPKFSLSALMGSTTTVGGHLFDSPANVALGAFGLRWRLFDFGRVDAEVKAAKGKNAEALAAYRLSVLQATADIENAFSALVKREAQEKLFRDGETSLSHARDSIAAGYARGTSSYVNVLEADSRLEAIQDARIIAQSSAARAAIASFKALGGGWDDDKATIGQDVAAMY